MVATLKSNTIKELYHIKPLL